MPGSGEATGARGERQAAGGRAAATRARLLAAATRAFADRGFARASVREICAAAGCNIAAVSYHFGDKAGLHRAVLLAGFEREAFPPADDPARPARERLHALVAAFLGRLLAPERHLHARVMARELVEPTPALREVVEVAFRPLHDRIRALVRALRPDLRPADADLHTMSVIGQCVVYRHARPALDVLHGPEALGAADVPRLARHIAAQALGGLGRHDLLPLPPLQTGAPRDRPRARRAAARRR
ncbi:MAG: CerR family C-terminal domain-containing protein [Planctomycetes bacterium]|nr:CerR family C-terminal domain-containing protein [Planctomycetota bacterium]